jgi:hypothetical protein
VSGGLHTIDGSRVWLGWGDGAIAGVALPKEFSRPREAETFPAFGTETDIPDEAHLVTAVWWSWEEEHGEREAFFVGPSASPKWDWVLYKLTWCNDEELWSWSVNVAAARAFPDLAVAAAWLLESWWFWDAARLGRRAALFDGVWCDGLVTVDEAWTIGQRTLIPWPSDPNALFRPTPFLRLSDWDGNALIVNMDQVTKMGLCATDPSRTTLHRTRCPDHRVGGTLTVREDLHRIQLWLGGQRDAALADRESRRSA